VFKSEDKGRGIMATKIFPKGTIICEYPGELLNLTEMKKRESGYEKDPSIGCYMYYFTHKGKKMW